MSLKSLVKNNKITHKTYFWLLKKMFSSKIIPNTIPTKLYYRISTGKKLNLKNPENLNEKIQWMKLYYKNPLHSKCADKFEVREFVEKMGCKDTLNELYGVYDKAEEIDFDALPDKFAIKCTHGCGTNIICNSKSSLNREKAVASLNEWLLKTTGDHTGESHYRDITPKIIVEKYIGADDGTFPLDYKIFCFHGKPYGICVFSGRNSENHETKRCFFDFEWNHMADVVPERLSAPPQSFKKPACLDQMYEVAKKLSSPFPFVRCDLYEFENKVIFGELTFTPAGGISKGFSDKSMKEMGALLDLTGLKNK